jgi:hypothetical protein
MRPCGLTQRVIKLRETLNEALLGGVAVATSVTIFALPIYYVWKLVASFRRKTIPHWPPSVCLGLWFLQWPFFLVAMAGCMGGGCDEPVRNWLEVLGTLAYNSIPAYWLWRRSAVQAAQ